MVASVIGLSYSGRHSTSIHYFPESGKTVGGRNDEDAFIGSSGTEAIIPEFDE
jgi:hypothetical protein